MRITKKLSKWIVAGAVLVVLTGWLGWIGHASGIAPTDKEMSAAQAWARERFQTNAASVPFSFLYAGRPSSAFIGSWQSHVETKKLDKDRTQHTVTFTDPKTGLRIRMEGVAFSDFPAVEWVLHLTNTGTTDTPVLARIRPLDVEQRATAGEKPARILRYSLGALCSIDDFKPIERSLGPDAHIHLEPGGGRSSSEVLPFFNVQAGSAGVVLAIGWTGEWGATFSRKGDGNVRLAAGQATTHLKLHPGETIRTPRILLLFWNADHWRGNNLLRQFLLKHDRPMPNGKPLKLPIIESAWGGSPASQHLAAIRRIEAFDVPIKTYWIDAEWFGQGTWYADVGNWNVNAKLYPHGFRPIADALHASGRELLLWWEPERVCAGTPWYKFRSKPGWLLPLTNSIPEYRQKNGSWPVPHDDPRWVIDESHRSTFGCGEMLYNLGNPEARKYLINFTSKKIDEFGLDWYRQDDNIAPLEYWQHADTPDRVGITEIRYVEGLYAFWDALLQRHPGLKIDNCASGGRRIDIETIGRATTLHRTDWAHDSRHAQCQSYGIFGWVPLQMAGRSAVLSPGNEYNLRSIMGPGFMVSLGGDNTKAFARATLKQYRSIRKFFYGDYYPLSPYSQAKDVWMAWQFDRPDLGSGLVQAFRREQSPDQAKTYRLHGLDPDATYVVTDLDEKQPHGISGRALMGEGLAIHIPKQPGAALITYVRK